MNKPHQTGNLQYILSFTKIIFLWKFSSLATSTFLISYLFSVLFILHPFIPQILFTHFVSSISRQKNNLTFIHLDIRWKQTLTSLSSMSFITVREDFKDDNSTTVSILVKQISGTLLDTNLTLPCCKNSQVLYERLKISYVFNNIRMLLETEEFMLLRTNCICTNIYKSSRTKGNRMV